MAIRPQYVVDDQGHRTGVILSLDEFHRLLETAEDQLDSADLAQAVASESDFEPYADVRERLRREGKL